MKLTPTKVLHYGLLLVAAYIVYSWLSKGGGRDSYEHHPRNKAKFKDGKGQGHKYAEDARVVKGDDADVENKLNFEEQKKYQDEGVRKNLEPEKEKKHQKEKVDKEEENIREETKEGEKAADEKGGKLVEDTVKDTEERKPESEEVEGQNIVKDTKEEEEGKNFKKLKVKGKGEEGEDLLKNVNDADINHDPEVLKHIDRLSDHKNVKIPKLKREWNEFHDDIDTAAFKVKRRKEFFEKVMKYAAPEDMEEDKHIRETKDDFVYVTAASSDTMQATLTFIYSIQYNYPKNEIGIVDIGLSKEDVKYLETICGVTVTLNFLPLFPEFLRKNPAQKLWRPIALQVAAARFGHFVYLDPNRYLKKGVDLRGHFTLSRKGGAAMFGNIKRYSSAIVTHPEMYYYLAINVKKLLKLQHVEITMMIMHNSDHLHHFFTRWLLLCATDEYCISPPGSKRKCDQNLYPKSKRYADCHRYDDSAINILLASWHKYDFDHYAAADYVTKPYDGRDSKPFLKFCKTDDEL